MPVKDKVYTELKNKILNSTMIKENPYAET